MDRIWGSIKRAFEMLAGPKYPGRSKNQQLRGFLDVLLRNLRSSC